jgi:hypothetical protein
MHAAEKLEVNWAAEPAPASMLIGVLGHLSCFLQTGRARSAHAAIVLLERLAMDPDANAPLRDHCRVLSDVLGDVLGAPAVAAQ